MTESAMVCDGCHQEAGHAPGCASRGRHQHHNTVPVEECLFHREQQARIVAQADASARRREIRAVQRQQFTEARDIGIQRRHAAKTGPLSATQSHEIATPVHPGTTTNGGKP